MPREHVKHLELKYTQVSYEMLRTCQPNEIALYCAIKLHAINKDKAWPSYSTFHKILGWSRERISNTIKLMVQSRRLVVTKTPNRPTVYDITAYDLLAHRVFSSGSETELPLVRKPNRNWFGNRTGTIRNERLGIEQGGATRARSEHPVDKSHRFRRAMTKDELERLALGIHPK